jgi:DNA-binding NarL/FixJ family response regulator
VPNRLRIVLAEDNYLVREGTRRLLEDSGEVDVVAAVGNADELHDAVRRFTPQAVLTDIRMSPDHHMEGIEAAHAIRRQHPGTGVAVLSQHTDEAYAFALFRDGTSCLAYLLKDRLGDVEDLIRALRKVTEARQLRYSTSSGSPKSRCIGESPRCLHSSAIRPNRVTCSRSGRHPGRA